MRVAAVGDLHCTKASQGALQPLFAAASANADVLLLCGDLTDYGLPEEARVLARELGAALRVPAVAVLGNHDYESGQQEEVVQILRDAGVVILDGDACEVAGLGIGGVKGLCGGFGERALQPWGEEIMKRFVRETVDEALKLETGARRACARRSGWPSSTTRRSRPRWKASRPSCTRSWARAGSRSRSTAIR